MTYNEMNITTLVQTPPFGEAIERLNMMDRVESSWNQLRNGFG